MISKKITLPFMLILTLGIFSIGITIPEADAAVGHPGKKCLVDKSIFDFLCPTEKGKLAVKKTNKKIRDTVNDIAESLTRGPMGG